MKYLVFIPLLLINHLCFSLRSYSLSYRSHQSGNYHDITTWENFYGGVWINATNIPGSGDNIIILSSHIVNVTSVFSVNDVEIQTNAIFNVQGSILIHVSGYWLNNGTFNAGTSTIDFNGFGTQDINGSTNFYNLTLTNVSKISFLNGSVTRVANIFNTTGNSAMSIDGSTIEYNGTSDQYIADFTYYNLIVSNGGRKTMQGTGVSYNSSDAIPSPDAVNPANIKGDLIIAIGTVLDIANRGVKIGQYKTIHVYGTIDFSTSSGFITRSEFSGGSVVLAELYMMSSGLIKTANPAGFGLTRFASFRGNGGGNFNISSASTNGTIEYYSSVAQTITDPNTSNVYALQSYHNLILSGNSTKTWQMGSNRNVLANLTISSSSVLNLIGAGTSLNIGGNWVNNGNFSPGTKTIDFNGVKQQAISGNSITTFYNLTNSNSSAVGLSLSGTNVVVDNILNFNSTTNGKLNIYDNDLTISSGGSIVNASADRYLVTIPTTATNGRLRQNNLSSSTIRIFPVGTPSLYLPVEVTPDANNSDFSVSVFRSTTADGLPLGNPFSSRENHVDAIWWIGQPVGNSNASIRLTWLTDGIEGSVFTTSPNNKIATWRGESTNPDFWTPAGTGFSNDNTVNFAETLPVSHFNGAIGYPYLVATIDLLPQLLKSFHVSTEKKNHILNWEVYDVGNIKFFETQYASDGINFNKINKIYPQYYLKKYSDELLTYNSDIYFYRLKIILNDGSFIFSPISKIKIDLMESKVIIRQTVNGTIHFNSGLNRFSKYRIVNSAGMLIKYGNVTQSMIELPPCSAGLYYLQLMDQKNICTYHFIKY